ncbi:hypothetical protein JX266_005614 [Neoarthrinium moseri]|nr:hypothetical protein JX266_005614 [Neoarthrinium moseri]
MHYHQPLSLAIFVEAAVAVTLPQNAANGLWILGRDENGNTKASLLDTNPELFGYEDGSGRAAWPWRKVQDEPHLSPSATLIPEPDTATTTTDTVVPRASGRCGSNNIDNESYYQAWDRMWNYCNTDGALPAYQHLASQQGTAIVYICARGHPSSCTGRNMSIDLQWVQDECLAQSGWVYNDVLNQGGPSNKYGREITGVEFC